MLTTVRITIDNSVSSLAGINHFYSQKISCHERGGSRDNMARMNVALFYFFPYSIIFRWYEQLDENSNLSPAR